MATSVEEQTLEDILKKIAEYKETIDTHEDNIKTQMGINLKGLIQGNNRAFLINTTKELITNTKADLALVKRAITPENLRSISGIKNIQTLLQRCIENIDEKAQRVFVNKGTPAEQIARTQLQNMFTDIKTTIVRFCEDILNNLVNLFTSSSEQNTRLAEVLDKDRNSLFVRSLAKKFTSAQNGLKEHIQKMRSLEQTVNNAEATMVSK